MANLFGLAAPILRRLPPETAHGLALRALARGLAPQNRQPDEPVLASRLWGLDFPNCVGLAAGFDKNAEAVRGLLGLGFGFVEIGTVTPRPQAGNPRPRLFRLREERAIINRMGFNNDGHDAVAARLKELGARPGIVGVNIGKNKDSEDAAADYVAGVRAFAGLADYLVLNVSSPNTPGLRALQNRDELTALLEAVMEAREKADPRPPILLKIAPDLTEEDRRDIALVALASGLDGLIVSNTTIARPEGLKGHAAGEAGGLSGQPLFAASTRLLGEMYRLTNGRIPLIGVGGVETAEQAYAKIRAGASLVQIYSGLIYQGPGLVRRIKDELALLLHADGFSSVTQAVGVDSRRGRE